MKKIIYASALLVSLTIASCGSDVEQVKTFAIDVANKVSKNHNDSVVMLYPEAAKADSLALSFIADSVVVAPADSADMYVVDFGGGKEMTVEVKDDSMVVVGSKGLFAYAPDDFDFAKKTGMWVDSLSDVENADRIAQKDEFRKYLMASFKAPKVLSVVQGRGSNNGGMFAMDFYGTVRYIVKNNSDKPIKGKDYRFTYRREDRGFPSRPSMAGRDLAPGASTTYSIGCGMWTIVSGASVVYTATKEQQFDQYFEPQGGEFDQYLETITPTDGKTPSVAADKDGKIKMSGKLNGKHGVKFELDKNFNGFMYYTSQGYNTNIKILGSRMGDNLILEESTNGNHTGTYSGTFDGKVYQGTFTRNKDGKDFSFYLSVE